MFTYFETYSTTITFYFDDDEIKDMFFQYKSYCETYKLDINDECNFIDFINNYTYKNSQTYLYKMDFDDSNIDDLWEYFKKINCNEFSKNS